MLLSQLLLKGLNLGCKLLFDLPCSFALRFGLLLGISDLRLRLNLRAPPLKLELGGLTKALLLRFTRGFLGLIEQQPVFLELLIFLLQLFEVLGGLRLGAPSNVNA